MADQATRTVDRAFALLSFVCAREGVSLTECARATGLAPSTALRLLRTIEVNGYIRKDQSDGTYRPGSRVIQLGAQAFSNESLVTLCRPSMDELVDMTQESVYLSIEAHSDTALYISIVEGTRSVRHASWVGRTVPLDGSAAGAVLRGQTPPQGYIIVERGIEPDITAIASPVTSKDRVIACLSLVIPSYRLSQIQAARCGRVLAKTAVRLSAGFAIPQSTSTGATT